MPSTPRTVQNEVPRLISVDDHVVEPAHVWESRLPAKYREVGPHVVIAPRGEFKLHDGVYREEPGDGKDMAVWWHYEDHRFQLKQIIADKARDPQRCQLISSQNERPTAPEPYQRVVVKVRMRCDLDDLTEILYELENATPFLFVAELNLYQQLMFQGGMPQPNLGDMDARFDVYGYIRKPGGQG